MKSISKQHGQHLGTHCPIYDCIFDIIGFIRRSCPQSLMLHAMKDRCTKARSPGPGPITKKEWSQMAEHTTKDQCA
eukprot:2747688-Amphidinium_carterae.3